MQDDIGQTTSGSRHSSRPASRNTFDENVDLSESHYAHLHQNLASMDAIRSSPTGSHTYASALAASMSRSTTPDPRVGGARNNGHSDLVTGFSNMTLSGSGAIGSPSHYQNLDSPSSPFYNGGYMMNPASPTMMANSVNLPPLFDNAAVAAAMGGGFGLGSNRGGNHSPNALQVPLMDPLYLQNLRSTEYTAALNDATIDRELLALQKAYLAGLLSPQKSQYGLNHGYYGNSGYGLGMSYPGSPLGSSLLPNSAFGSGSPGRHGDRSLRFPYGIRNLVSESFTSSLLDEFKNNKTKCFELSEIVGHVVEFRFTFFFLCLKKKKKLICCI